MLASVAIGDTVTAFSGVIGALALGWVASGQSVPWPQDEGPGGSAAGATTCEATTHVAVTFDGVPFAEDYVLYYAATADKKGAAK